MKEHQLALLRGINLGGRHSVPMAALAAVFAKFGCTEIETYIQSGNVVFAPPAVGLSAKSIAASIEACFGFSVPVVLRTRLELAQVLAANPFVGLDLDLKLLHVVFLAAPLSAAQVAALSSQIAGEEQMAAVGSELYLSLPHGGGRSKLASACIAPKLPHTNTMRNWPTVLKLAAMLGVL